MFEDFKWDTDTEDPIYVGYMIHYFYHLDYLEDSTSKVKKMKRENEDFNKLYAYKSGILIEHASMYAMGDKYGISGLKDLALRKYEEAYAHTSMGFANSIIVAYTSTVDNDMQLRNVIIKFLNDDLTNLMRKPKINQHVKDLPLLSHALLRKQLKLDA